MTSGADATRGIIAPLTGLRAFAAAWVVLYHFRFDIQALVPGSHRLSWLFDAGYAGVDVFFVLSGFIISYTYLRGFTRLDRQGYGRFLWLRLARIYPVHLFTLAIFLVILPAGSLADLRPGDITSSIGTADFWRQIFLVHAWGTTGNHAWNFPAWSISAEWLAYLLFPLAAGALLRVRGLPMALAGLGGALLFNLVTFIAIDQAGRTGEIIVVRIAGEFAAGCFLFLLFDRGWGRRWDWAALTPAAAVASIAATMAIARWDEIAPVLAAPFYALLILGLAYDRGALAGFLGRRWLVYAGEASYALYMTHAVALRLLQSHLPAADFADDPGLVRFLMAQVYAAVIIVLAVVTYELVERPARRGMRAILGPAQGRAARAAADEPTPAAAVAATEPGPG